jgi:hypothetical protein
MMMKETEVKYLAGLIDADGHIGFEFTNNRCYLTLSITAADSIDRGQYVYNLPTTTGYGSSCKKTRRNGWSTVTVWKLSKKKDLEMLMPRLIKHMVIKGAHAHRMLDKWIEFRTTVLTDIQIEQLKQFTNLSRSASGPLKPKKHPTWAWVAGYLDGDGSFIFKKAPSQRTPRMYVQATAHENDIVALELLYKAFGGSVNNRGKAAPHIYDWKHFLGRNNKAFAIRFLSKVVQHSRLKKHKIESMLHFHHSKDSHRLSEDNPTG